MANSNLLLQVRNAEFKSPLDSAAQAAQVNRANAENAMVQRQADEQAKLDELYKSSNGDINAMMKNPDIGFGTGMKLREMQSAAEANKFKAQNEQIDYLLKQSEYSAQKASGVTDQAGWDALRSETASMLGQEAANHMPVQFSPQARDQYITGTMSFKDRIAQQRADQQAMQQDRMYNATMERIAASERNAAARGDVGVTKYTTIYDNQGRAFYVNPKDPTEKPIPIVTDSGAQISKPISGGGNASEDERKAAGWLAQSRLASKQMQDAMASDPNAAKKPFSESLASRVPFVTEEDINARRTPARQRFTAAASSFAEAALRAATGAGINEMEAKQKIAELTPQYGDSEDTIRDKTARQEMYINSLEQRAGRAAPKDTPPQEKTIVRTGTVNGRKVVQYSDGTKAYAE